MYMNDIKLFAQNEILLETLIQTMRIYNQDVGRIIGIEKRPIQIMKPGNDTWQKD